MIRLRVPGDLAYRDLVARAVSTACKLARSEPGLPEEFTHEVVSAIGEAFNNVAIHGYADREPGDVFVEIRTHADRLDLEVQDTGHSFHPDDAPEPDLAQLPESGMGLFIIRACMDEVTYEAGSPNVLTMVKRFPG